MIYVTENQDSGYIPETEDIRVRKFIQDLAEEYFNRNPEYSDFSVCIIDFEEKKSTIYRFESERKISCVQY